MSPGWTACRLIQMSAAINPSNSGGAQAPGDRLRDLVASRVSSDPKFGVTVVGLVLYVVVVAGFLVLLDID
jgi:hypothetical protein